MGAAGVEVKGGAELTESLANDRSSHREAGGNVQGNNKHKTERDDVEAVAMAGAFAQKPRQHYSAQ
jgi:hypothetical protein